ncbi:ABC-2 type transport system ATP-binding protein [Hathewaya proteolytica DSM 3090]|uniref:ABC-2 type transport system ATP-binding protein n=1 Tax=Hathewaya proteolytica DSM 3090 TaxID=1121331 RepID=A0A1M6R2V4_9CLOT|nr:ATP-binding cassette domain-containing protein [Hathewaya proteolytica]SHK26841.1 ABC-2 type transport system ATP-binding protein [Hathewaya proteolytica DSM 3090]
MENILETMDLTKTFKKVRAVDDVNIHVKRGGIYGIIGENGAGKTTILKIVSGLINASSGNFKLFGCESSRARSSGAFSKIGSLLEYPAMYPNMTAMENMKTKGLCAGFSDEKYLKGLLQLAGLEKVGKKRTKFFSLGMKQRLGIAMALIGEPELLLLDEPINGLDPQGIADVRNMLKRLVAEKNITILVSSHILEELFKIASSFAIVHKGKLIVEATKEEIQQQCGQYTEMIVGDTSKAKQALEEKNIGGVTYLDDNILHLDMDVDVAEVNFILADSRIPVTSIVEKKKSLEEYYFSIIGGGKNA